MCSLNAPVRSMTGPACAAGCVLFYPGPMPRAGPVGVVRRAKAGQVLPTRSRRTPGRADGGPACASCLCHICVIYEQKFNFSVGRPPDRPKAKKVQPRFLCYIYNIKINKPRLHAHAPHARLTRARTRPPARITRARVK